MTRSNRHGYFTEHISTDYLSVNSCGIEFISSYDRGSERPAGRMDYHILYVEKGICRLNIDGEWTSVPEGGVILFRPGEPQIYRYLKEDESISHYIHFTGVGCEGLFAKLGLNGVRVFMMGRSASYEELSEKLTMEFSMRGPLYEDVSAACLYQMLCIIGRKYAARSDKKSGDERISVICRRIYENISDIPSADELAAECCLSVSRFTHLFKDATGKSLGEYVRFMRIERAKDLLASTEISVREVGEAVGYEDQNYFSRCFLRDVGCSPREYRKREKPPISDGNT